MRLAAATLAALVATLSAVTSASGRDLVLAPTGEAALAQPMVMLAIDPGRASATRSRDDLSDLVGDVPAVAILDTGASGHILSHASAARFGVTAETGSRYVEVGMSGEHGMEVSRPVTLTVGALEPDDDDQPRRGRAARPESVRLTAQRLLLNEAPADAAAALLSPGALVDVIGMPLIRDHVIEIVPTAGGLGTLTVRLHASTGGPGINTWVPLALVDFNRRHPRNRGPLPALATNPMVEEVVVESGAAEVEGDWLLDTGAVCSMISTATARRLGLVDADGDPVRAPDFTLPVGGVGGGHRALPGFRVDRLLLTASDGRRLAFPRPALVVHDVTTTRPDGTTVTLDGILGMNLLLPSGSGMTTLGATRQHPGPFDRVVIDVANDRLGFTLRP